MAGSTWILVFSVWYSLSTADGSFRFDQVFDGLESEVACNKAAKVEEIAIGPYTQKWYETQFMIKKGMTVVNYNHWCITQEEVEAMVNGTD